MEGAPESSVQPTLVYGDMIGITPGDLTPDCRHAGKLRAIDVGDADLRALINTFERHVSDASHTADTMLYRHRATIGSTAGRRKAYKDALRGVTEARSHMRAACGISFERPAGWAAGDDAAGEQVGTGEAPPLPMTASGIAPPVAPEGYVWALIPLPQRPATCAASAEAGVA